MDKIIWAGSGRTLNKITGSLTYDKIPNGVWEVHSSLMGPFMEKVSDDFNFPHKIYGLEENFIEHSLRTFDVAEKNMGILLNGMKGCGKTVTAKILANKSNLPVILITAESIDLLSYFTGVDQPLCFFFDEFEKIIDHKDMARIAPLLSFVDGTATAGKHLMIFTSNETRISEFFIDRPGRIRYIKNYGSLDMNTVREILDDKLIYPEFRQDIINWVMYFKFLTIDVLISIINEVNIHKAGPATFKKFFNADNDKASYELLVTFTDPDTNQKIQFNGAYDIDDDPASFFEDVLERDTNARFKTFKSYMDPATGMIAEIKDMWPGNESVLFIAEIEDLEEGVYRFYGSVGSRPEGTISKFDKEFMVESSPEMSIAGEVPTSKAKPSYEQVYVNEEKNAFIIHRKLYIVDLAFKPRALYKNFNGFMPAL